MPATRFECTTSGYAKRHKVTQTYAKRLLDRMVADGYAEKLAGDGRGSRSRYRVLLPGNWYHDPFNLCPKPDVIVEVDDLDAIEEKNV